jgi:TonB family protein
MPTDFEFNGRDPKGNLIGGGNGDTLGADNNFDPGGPHDGPPSDHPGAFNDRDLPADTVIFVEQNVTYDVAELEHAIEYPEIARRTGLEGYVVVRVLIDRMGRPVRTVIDRSDNPVFVEAAVKAVTSIPYTSARQNHIPVAVWIQIPVSFSINR